MWVTGRKMSVRKSLGEANSRCIQEVPERNSVNKDSIWGLIRCLHHISKSWNSAQFVGRLHRSGPKRLRVELGRKRAGQTPMEFSASSAPARISGVFPSAHGQADLGGLFE